MAQEQRVLLATSWRFPSAGGVSSHMELLAECLGMRTADVVSFRDVASGPPAALRRTAWKARMRLRRAFGREQLTLWADAMSAALAQRQFAVVHCHDPMATWAAARLRRRSRNRFAIVSTVHGPVSRHMVEEGHPAASHAVLTMKACEVEAWREADALVAVDRTQAALLIEQGADIDRLTVIRNAVNAPALRATAAAMPLVRHDSRPWVCVPRRLTPKNGVEVAIRAIGQMLPRPRLLLAGEGLLREQLTILVEELGLQEDVLFLGALEHSVLLPLLAASDVVLVPSVPVHGIVEATSISALESMALGKPVIASAVGGLVELISNGETGVLVPPGDPGAWAVAMRDLLSDPVRARALGAAAAASVDRDFSVGPWFDRHMEIYRALALGQAQFSRSALRAC